jgi:hypothetical protein
VKAKLRFLAVLLLEPLTALAKAKLVMAPQVVLDVADVPTSKKPKYL